MKRKFSTSILYLAVFVVSLFFFANCKTTSSYDNKRIVNSFLYMSDSTSSEMVFNYQNLYKMVQIECENIQDPIESIAKKVTLQKDSDNIFICLITQNKTCYNGHYFLLSQGKIKSYTKELDKSLYETFIFRSPCDGRFFRIKNKSKNIINDYSLMIYNDKNNSYHFFNLKEDSLGIEMEKIRDQCNSVFTKEIIYHIDRILNC